VGLSPAALLAAQTAEKMRAPVSHPHRLSAVSVSSP